jgi:hypothetical protein
MRFGTRYRWAYAAAVLASIPIITPGFWCGAPLGIWALIVLHRRDVKEAFARSKNPIGDHAEQTLRNAQ